jgi:hypothetical protein
LKRLSLKGEARATSHESGKSLGGNFFVEEGKRRVQRGREGPVSV